MSAESPSVLRSRLELFPRVAAFGVPLVGGLVLLGWALDIDLLKRVSPGLVSMNPMTAMAFILAGAALWVLLKAPPTATTQSSRFSRDTRWRRIGQACAVLVIAVGAVKFASCLAGWDAGIDQLFFRDKLASDQTLHPNRMAPNTALNFLLIGVGLLLLNVETRRGQRPAQYLAVLVCFMSMLALIGYAYQVKAFYGVFAYIPMAVHTAATFALLSLATLCARPGKGLMAILTSDGPGGIMARRLLPTTVIALAALGWLRLEGERRGFFGDELGVTLHTTATIVICAALVWWSAKSLHDTGAERRRVEEERERLFTLSLDMLCIAGFDGYFKRLNPAWEKTLGFTREELLAQPYLDFIHPDDRQATLAEGQKVATGVTVISFENRYRCKDGSYRWFLWSATPVVGEQLIYATARDITERRLKDAQIQQLNADLESRAAQLQAANKELEAFSYSVSHDLRAPLRHIGGFLELLQKSAGPTLEAKNQRYLKLVSESAGEMGRLIDDLLDFSRMGRAEMRSTRLDLEQLVKDAINDLGRETAGRDIVWKIEPLPEVQADPALMRQVLVNLLSNALKYSRTRARAEIGIGCQSDHNGEHVFFVRDNGVGFDMKYAERLFGVFQRLHGGDEFEGTGIGLANVQRIVSRHGGRTWAEGIVDGGATFYFSLPKSQKTKL